jgi:hypothetical protein
MVMYDFIICFIIASIIAIIIYKYFKRQIIKERL